MKNATYDKLKFVAQVGLPAAGTFWFSVASIWGIPFSEQVLGTIVALDTLLGVLLGLQSASYNRSGAAYNGTMQVVNYNDGSQAFGLALDRSPDEMVEDGKVTFKVEKAEVNEDSPAPASPGELPKVYPSDPQI